MVSGLLYYADNVVIISPNERKLQKLISSYSGGVV